MTTSTVRSALRFMHGCCDADLLVYRPDRGEVARELELCGGNLQRGQPRVLRGEQPVAVLNILRLSAVVGLMVLASGCMYKYNGTPTLACCISTSDRDDIVGLFPCNVALALYLHLSLFLRSKLGQHVCNAAEARSGGIINGAAVSS